MVAPERFSSLRMGEIAVVLRACVQVLDSLAAQASVADFGPIAHYPAAGSTSHRFAGGWLRLRGLLDVARTKTICGTSVHMA